MRDILIDLLRYTPMYITGFWALVLMSQPKQDRAKRFLGVFMFVAFLLYLCHAVYFNILPRQYLFFDSLYTFSSLLVYPLFYLYIRVLSHDELIRKKDLLLFIPAVVFSAISVVLYIMMSAQERIDYVVNFLFLQQPNLLETPLQTLQHRFYILHRFAFTIQVIYFLIKGSRLVMQYNKRIANFYSNPENKKLSWVNLLLVAFVVTSLMSIVFNMIGKIYFISSPVLLMVPSIIFSVLLFSIGIFGLMQNFTVSNLVLEEKDEIVVEAMVDNTSKMKNNLLGLFEHDKIYKNSELRITDVSYRLQTNRTYASKLINNEFSCSFSEFVNKYRINEAKELLGDKSQKIYTLEYISNLVGFGSLHSFIRVFKRSEGITPGIYRDKLN